MILLLSSDVNVEYISITIVYFYLKYYELLLYNKCSNFLITASKM